MPRSAPTLSGLQQKMNLLIFIMAVTECLFFAGIIFGWANIRPVMYAEGYFDTCSRSSRISNLEANVTEESIGNVSLVFPPPDCEEQKYMFSLVFTISSSMLNFSSLFTGFFLDLMGTLVSKIAATFLFTSGCLMIALSTPSTAWLLFPAYSFLLPVGGYWHLISNFQIGNLFEKRQGTVITLLSGCFDSSSFVFVVFRVLYENGISLRNEFLVYSAASLFLLLNAVFNLPRTYIPFPLPEDWTKNWKPKIEKKYSQGEGIKLPDIQEKNEASEEDQTAADKNGNVEGAEDSKAECKSGPSPPLKRISSVVEPKQLLRDQSFLSCLTSMNYVLHVLFVSVNQLKLYCFMGTAEDFVKTFDLQPETELHYLIAFGITQLTGVFFAPLMGVLVDRNKKYRSAGSSPLETLHDFVLPLALTALTGLLFSALLLVPVIQVQYATFIVQVMFRAFTYGLAFSFLSCNFPVQHIGKLIGIMMAVAGSISLLQLPIFMFVSTHLDGDPTYLNMAFAGLGCIAFVHPLHVMCYTRSRAPPLPRLDDDVEVPLSPVRTESAA